jgi:hypothetical protein
MKHQINQMKKNTSEQNKIKYRKNEINKKEVKKGRKINIMN